MAYEIEDDIMSLSLIDGPPEVGKTQFLDFIMQQDYSKTEGKIPLTMCEEGDTGYDEKKSERNRVAAVLVDDTRKLTPQCLNELEVIYQPERVLVEWNGMWGQNDLKLPDDWTICRQITIIDDFTFEPYVQNMKPFLRAMLRDSELVIVNRCDGILDNKLTAYRRIIRAMSRESETVLRDKEGEIEQAALEEDLSYDFGAGVIGIKPEDYGVWYIDCMDQSECYKDEVMGLTVMIFKPPRSPKDQFVPGCMAVACYETNMASLGFMYKWSGAEDCKTEQWVRVRAKIDIKYQKDYHDKGPVLYVERVERAEEIKDVVQFQE